MSRCGRILAQLCRLIGAPLPLSRDAFVPAVVSVTEDPAGGGQFWTRLYGRRRGFPQVIHSAKRFCRPDRPRGIYRPAESASRFGSRWKEGALHFLSDHYFVSALGAPAAPAALALAGTDAGQPYRLRPRQLRLRAPSLDHPGLGELICQTAMFEERREPEE
jgi:hypothetical protein